MTSQVSNLYFSPSPPKNTKEYIFRAKEEIEQQEKLLDEDLKRGIVDADHHWDSEQMRQQ